MFSFLPAVTAVLIPFASYHVDPKEEHEQFNPGIVVEMDWLAAGIYRNSFDKPSIFVQAAWWTPSRDVPLIGKIRVGLSGGLATGYQYPVIGGIQMQGKYWNVTFVPKAPWDELSSHTFGFSLRMPL